ncbi:MAG: zinc-dependent metalloprotease [Frankiaceae bacterium]
MTAEQLIDWRFAAVTARRLVPPGPQIGRDEAKAVVADLKQLATVAESHVRDFTRLDPGDEPGDIVVVDRPGWVTANIDGFRVILEPVIERLISKRQVPNPTVVAVGSRVTGAELGGLLAYLATKVLGQYELFLPEGQGKGRLSLVAPNIVATEQTLGVDPHDFRLWVCLHEMAHRVQFTAVPWLREHVRAEIASYVDAIELDPITMLRRLLAMLGAAFDAVRGRGELSFIELVQTPAQRAVLDRLTAVMSLLEGHAEFVMDGVGPQVVPSVEEIRRRFDRRRHDISPFDRVIRQLLGLDAKMRQYSEGVAFVRGVTERAGIDGLNKAWESPATLPTRAEISDPGAWVARVVGH